MAPVSFGPGNIGDTVERARVKERSGKRRWIGGGKNLF